LPVPSEVTWVVLVPDAQSSTAEARALLPPTVSRAEAVFNLQRMGLLLAALATARAELLALGMEDKLHQPQRLPLFPWMETVRTAALEAGALGCALSGAGPALLAAARGAPEPVAGAMERALRRAGGAGRAFGLAVDTAGATWNRAGRSPVSVGEGSQT